MQKIYTPEQIREAVEDLDELTVVAGPGHQIAGSKQVVCACGAFAWLSPATQDMMKRRGAAPTLVICTQCWVARLEKEHAEA